MTQLQKILRLIESESWEQLISQFDQLIMGEGQKDREMQSQTQLNWLYDYTHEKIKIITQLDKKYQYLALNQIQAQQSQSLNNFQESVIKLFAKGLILPELNRYEDIEFLHKFISSSKNAKYLFMLYQQNLYQMHQIYHSQSLSIVDKINLKSLSIIPAFLKLMGQNIFSDILKKFNEFYGSYRKIQSQENVIGEPDKQLVQFSNHFINKTLSQLQKLIGKNINPQLVKKLIEKPVQRKQLFQLLKLLFTHHTNHIIQVKRFVNILITKLQLGIQNHEELPSFWICDQLQLFCKIYHKEHLLFAIGSILICQLPSRPQYSQIPNHLLDLLQWTLINLLTRQQPIKNLSFQNNSQFYVQLFERLSILMGILTSSNQKEKQLNQMIKTLINKKDLFNSSSLAQILWRKIFTSHDDLNFKIFCLNQYKKVFLVPIKKITSVQMQILNSASPFMIKLVSSLEGNSNAQFIGFILTLVIYYFSFLKKIHNLCFKNPQKIIENEKQQKSQIVIKYLFGHEKMSSIKQEIREKLHKLKQSLKDRLEVYKMKNQNQSQDSTQIQKQANQISICLYRIEQEIKFD